MPDDKKEEIIEGDDQKEMDADMYLEKLKELKKDMVPRKDYDKVVEDRKRLADEIANGGYGDQDEDQEDPVDVKELKKKLFSRDSNLSNLEYAEAALELRDEMLKRGETDPFLPVGAKVHIEDSDIEAAQKVADVLRECVDDAEGDPDQFTLNLQKSIR